MFSTASVIAFLGALWGQLWALVLPWLIKSAIWIAAIGSGILAWLFSPAIRKWTIAAVAIIAVLAGFWVSGFLHGQKSSSSDSICSNPHFHQVILRGKFSASVIDMVKEHNDLGAALGCWSNDNIR